MFIYCVRSSLLNLHLFLLTNTRRWSIAWLISTTKKLFYEIKIDYSYVISEPDLFPRCSPVSIPRVPAPPPKPTPFGPYIREILYFQKNKLPENDLQIYEHSIVYRINYLHVLQVLLIQASSYTNLLSSKPAHFDESLIKRREKKERNSIKSISYHI
jgi:hypothetical protein